MTKKYLFLDIDGVLNTGNYQNHLSQQGLPTTDNWGLPMFDPEAVTNLRKIIDATGAEIIISSSWKYEGLDILKKSWKERGLPGKIKAITPNSRIIVTINGEDDWVKSGSRGAEIEGWLINYATAPYQYVILDDETDLLYCQKDHFVEIDDMMGITAADAERAITILNS